MTAVLPLFPCRSARILLVVASILVTTGVRATASADSPGQTDTLTATEAAGHNVALIQAVRRGTPEEVRRLLDAGADPEYSARPDDSPLFVAVCRGNSRIIEMLLDKGADINRPVFGGVSPVLIPMAEKGRMETLRLLLARGANVNARGGRGTTALMAALQRAEPERVRLLLLYGADPNARNERGESVLAKALQWHKRGRRQDATIEMLKRAGAKP